MKGNRLPERLQGAVQRWGIKEPTEESIKCQGNILAYCLPYRWEELLQRADRIVTIKEESSFPIWKKHQFRGKRVMFETGHGLSMVVNCVHIDVFYEGVVEYPGLPPLTLGGPHLLGFQNEEEVYPQIRIGPSTQHMGPH